MIPTQPMPEQTLRDVMARARDVDSNISSVSYNKRIVSEVAGAGTRDELVIEFERDTPEAYHICMELVPDGYDSRIITNRSNLTIRIYRPGKEV